MADMFRLFSFTFIVTIQSVYLSLETLQRTDSRFNAESNAYTQFLRTGFPPPTDVTIEAMRERAEAMHEKINEKLIGTFRGKIEQRKVPIDQQTEIPITIYTPIDVIREKIVVFFHGGGWTVNSRKTHQTIVNILADTTKTIWISVEYRLAPEYKFPIWLDDACEVTRQILANKTAFGGNENTKVGVAGDSAGGLIAASICQTVKNLDFQILVCPQLDFFHRSPSRQEFRGPIFGLTVDVLDWFASNALRNEDDKKNPRVAILHHQSLDSLPRCLFIVAELDPLRDDSYNYREILEKAGVQTKLVLIKGLLHPFFSYPGIFAKSCQQAIDAIHEFLANI